MRTPIQDSNFLSPNLLTQITLCAPAGIPEEVRNVWVPAIEQAIKNPEIMSKMQQMRFLPGYKSPAEHRQLLIDDYETARGLARKIEETK